MTERQCSRCKVSVKVEVIGRPGRCNDDCPLNAWLEEHIKEQERREEQAAHGQFGVGA